MIRRTQSGPLVFTDFLERIREDQKADLIDGVIYMASPENWSQNQLKGWLTVVLGLYVEQWKLGAIAVDRFAFKLTDQTAPEPDLAFIRTERLHLVRGKQGYLDGPPDLAVEIVSPDSISRDYEDKRLRYEEAGVREYWILDSMEESALFLALEQTGFVEFFPEDYVFHSRVLPGFELDVRWLWQRPLPPTLPIVQRLLGIQPD